MNRSSSGRRASDRQSRPQLDDDAPGCAGAPSPSGEEIVAGMTAGRDWWQLRAFDVAPWIRSLPVSIRTDKHNRLGWLGRPWDGHNDLPVGEWAWDGERELDEAEPLVDDIDAWDGTIVPGHELKKLIAELRRLIAAKPGLGVALPDYRDVRATLVGEEGDVSEPTSAMAVVDFDIGEMILPIGIDDWQLRPDTWRPVEEVAALMVSMLVDTLSSRRKLLRRERKMREGFERDVARFGGGASPLWLRMEPVRFTSRRSKLFRQPYVALDVELGIYQVWAPSGLEQVSSAPRLRKVYSRRGSGHCRNVERIKVLRATGSIGWISDVALALIEQAGRNPAAVFKQELDAALHDGSHDHYGCDGHFGALFCHYGVLNPFFTFDGGCYSDGTLTLQVDLHGACNSECVGAAQYSASGGQLDFVRGAFASRGGKSIIACHSTAAKGTVSRIVAHLDGPVTTPRNDTHIVVTEHGWTDLKGKTLEERSLALISIAHPDFREQLERRHRDGL